MLQQRRYRSIYRWPWGSAHELCKRLGVTWQDVARARECELLVEGLHYVVERTNSMGRPQYVFNIPKVEEDWPELQPLVAEINRVGVKAFRLWWRGTGK